MTPAPQTSKKPLTVKDWLKELTSARTREKKFRKEATRILRIYEGQEETDVTFNILYSNTETMLPALYSQVPRPVVKRRFNDADPLGGMASRACERMLAHLADTNHQGYDSFDVFMNYATVSALVPGRGLTWFQYDAVMEPQAAGAEVGATDTEISIEALTEAGEEPGEVVSSEMVCAETVPWNRFLCGYGKTWKQVPWVAREHFFSRAEMEENFPDLYSQVPLDCTPSESAESEDERKAAEDPDNTTKLAHVVEIWDKVTKRVYFLAPSWPEKFLRNVPDPLNLSGFFPCPRPMQFVEKLSCLTPVPLYSFYRAQAEELNHITARIRAIIKAIKVRGFYDSNLQGLDKLMQQEENTLLPVEGLNALMQGQTAQNSLWLMPVEKLIVVLQQLLQERQAVKAVIYEITGISDILRGASQASETATAQNIKSQWGSLRIKRLQKEVQRYARDAYRIMAEIAVQKFGEQTWADMTGLTLPTAQDKQQAQAIAQQLQMAGQPLDQNTQQVLQLPSWEDVTSLLRDNLHRRYRIDIETNSTVEADATEDKQQISELLNALSQFLNGVTPLIQSGVLPFDVAKEMLLTIARRYQFGDEMEEALKQMKPPPPEQGKDSGKQDAFAEQLKQTTLKMQAEVEQKRAAQELEKMQLEHALSTQELQQKAELSAISHKQKLTEIHAKVLSAAATRKQKGE